MGIAMVSLTRNSTGLWAARKAIPADVRTAYGKREEKKKRRSTATRTPRPKPKVEFTIDAIDYKNVALLKQYVTDNGRVLPRKYTGLPAPFQRKLSLAIKRARQMLLMK